MQNWNNVLDYIKVHVGVPVNNFELSDDIIVKQIKEHVLPEFSQYVPSKKWVLLTEKVIRDNNFHDNSYKLQIETFNFKVVDVHDVYFYRNSSIGAPITSFLINPTEAVLSNTFADMQNYLQPADYFQFIKPDLIRLKTSDMLLNNGGYIAELNVEHTNPETIDSDMYIKVFRDMALKHILIYVLQIRNKFRTVTSPYGEISLDVDNIRTKIESLDQKITDFLNFNPPRNLVEWI